MAKDIHTVGVIGIGLMGSGIAQVAATRGFETIVVDVSDEILQRGKARIGDSLQRLARSFETSSGAGIASADAENALRRIHTSTARIDLLPCDIVIEAIVENEVAKVEVITSLKGMDFEQTLVSNTSSISITRLAAGYSQPERFMGMHFTNPVPVQPSCELIRGLQTSEETGHCILPATWQRTDPG